MLVQGEKKQPGIQHCIVSKENQDGLSKRDAKEEIKYSFCWCLGSSQRVLYLLL